MAGGTFDIGVGKVRPGTYINFLSKKVQAPSTSERGIVVLPLINYDWGPRNEFITLTNAAPDAGMTKFGRSIYDNNEHMLMIKEAFKNAVQVHIFITGSGKEAEKTVDIDSNTLKIKAKYPGTLGNSIKVSSIANVDSGFDVNIYLNTDIVETAVGITTINELAAKNFNYVTFSGEGAMDEFASASLEGGTSTTSSNADITMFLDKCEMIQFHTMAFPIDESALHTALKTKIQYLRENMGKKVQAVAPGFKGDYEGIINVTNSAIVDGIPLTTKQATAFVAGITAAADKVTSNTYIKWTGATELVNPKTNEEAIQSIKNGEFFFSMDDDGTVIVEYDINSLTSFTEKKTEDYRKNRIIRVYDSLATDLKVLFPPNKFDNSKEGWAVMEELGIALLQQYEEAGAIQNVDKETDFYVDQSRSSGDSTYFNVGIQAVDSAEKLYFTISTR